MTRRRRPRSRGAALVEFVIVAPLLFLLLFGIIEFGWAFLQYLDVRHGARETARLAAVNYGTSTDGSTRAGEIIDEGCSRMDTADGSTVTVERTSDSVGSQGRVEVTTDLETLTGFFDTLLGSVTLDSQVEIRLEQQADWSTRTKACP